MLWLFAVIGGFCAVIGYEMTPGTAPSGRSIAAWPEAIPFDSSQPNLLVFAHPRCPCTRATLSELERILTERRGQVAVTVLFYSPTSEPASWMQTGLWRRAQSWPGVTVRPDVDGQIAASLGVQTSGHVLLLDREGRQVFSGGITGARGHEGDNAGRRAVVAGIRGTLPSLSSTSVYGCSLQLCGDLPATPQP